MNEEQKLIKQIIDGDEEALRFILKHLIMVDP